MNDIFREFLIETHENLAQLDVDLLTLEKNPRELETLARVFRTLHTVKGTAGFLGLIKLQTVSHAGESLLSRLRAQELVFTPETATALLAVVDAIRTILAALEATQGGGEGSSDYSDLVRTLEQLTNAVPGRPVTSAGAPGLPKPPTPVSKPTPAAPSGVGPSPTLHIRTPFAPEAPSPNRSRRAAPPLRTPASGWTSI